MGTMKTLHRRTCCFENSVGCTHQKIRFLMMEFSLTSVFTYTIFILSIPIDRSEKSVRTQNVGLNSLPLIQHVLDTSTGSQMDLFKCKELRCQNI